MHLHCKGRMIHSRFHPACHGILFRINQSHLFDDNGITGPDWGHSEVVFGCFPIRHFHLAASLWNVPQRTRLVNVFSYCYATHYSFVNFICQ